MKRPNSKIKDVSFLFAAVDYHAIIKLINKLDSNAVLQIEATCIVWDETYVDFCKKHLLSVDRHDVFESACVITTKSIRDDSLLQILESLDNRRPAELIITAYSDANISDYHLKILIMYDESFADVYYDDLIPKKEIKRLFSECFIL